MKFTVIDADGVVLNITNGRPTNIPNGGRAVPYLRGVDIGSKLKNPGKSSTNKDDFVSPPNPPSTKWRTAIQVIKAIPKHQLYTLFESEVSDPEVEEFFYILNMYAASGELLSGDDEWFSAKLLYFKEQGWITQYTLNQLVN